MLITEKIILTVVPRNIQTLKKDYPLIKLKDKIEVNVNELTIFSPLKIKCKCEICSNENTLEFRKYLKNKNNYGYYSCKKCSFIKRKKTKNILYGDENYNNSTKMIQTKEKKGIYIPLDSKNYFKYYRKLVNRYTYKVKKELFKNWDGCDYYDGEYIKNNIGKIPSGDNNYPSIDHKESIYFGFKNNILPSIIGSLENLCITKRKHNLKKGK